MKVIPAMWVTIPGDERDKEHFVEYFHVFETSESSMFFS
jgi:hypothetical protein